MIEASLPLWSLGSRGSGGVAGLELAAEVQRLRRVVQRLAGTIMWDRASPAATVAEETARDKSLDGGSLRRRRGGDAGPAGTSATAHCRAN